MKQNLRRAVNLTALVLAAGLLIGLTGCFQPGGFKSLPIFNTDGHGVITSYNCDKEDLPKALVIPAKIGNEVITGISDGAFYGCTGLTSLDLSACTSLTVIGGLDRFRIDGAFEGCTGLTEVKLPANLTKIGRDAFEGCTGLTGELNLPASLTTIDYHAFKGCTGLTEVKLPASLTEIDGFSGCTGLTSIDLSSCTSLTKIGSSAFEGCTRLTSIDLSGCTSLTKIGWYAFKGCTGLTEVKLPASLTGIGFSTFEDCTGLTSIDLSGCTSLTEIYSSAFAGCTGLTEVKLPASLTGISSYAFKGCTGLTEVKLPASLTKIGKEAFKDCVNLTSAVFADKNVWKVYNNYDYSDTPTPISSTYLDNAETAARCLRYTYADKWWKKN